MLVPAVLSSLLLFVVVVDGSGATTCPMANTPSSEANYLLVPGSGGKILMNTNHVTPAEESDCTWTIRCPDETNDRVFFQLSAQSTRVMRSPTVNSKWFVNTTSTRSGNPPAAAPEVMTLASLESTTLKMFLFNVSSVNISFFSKVSKSARQYAFVGCIPVGASVDPLPPGLGGAGQDGLFPGDQISERLSPGTGGDTTYKLPRSSRQTTTQVLLLGSGGDYSWASDIYSSYGVVSMHIRAVLFVKEDWRQASSWSGRVVVFSRDGTKLGDFTQPDSLHSLGVVTEGLILVSSTTPASFKLTYCILPEGNGAVGCDYDPTKRIALAVGLGIGVPLLLIITICIACRVYHRNTGDSNSSALQQRSGHNGSGSGGGGVELDDVLSRRRGGASRQDHHHSQQNGIYGSSSAGGGNSVSWEVNGAKRVPHDDHLMDLDEDFLSDEVEGDTSRRGTTSAQQQESGGGRFNDGRPLTQAQMEQMAQFMEQRRTQT